MPRDTDALAAHDENRQPEIIRLLAYPVRCLVVESTWAAIEAGNWRSRVNSSAAVGSLLGWVALGLPIIMAENHERAGKYVARMLHITARRRWREARALVNGVLKDEEAAV